MASVGGALHRIPVLRESRQLLQRVALLVEHQVAAEGKRAARGPDRCIGLGQRRHREQCWFGATGPIRLASSSLTPLPSNIPFISKPQVRSS